MQDIEDNIAEQIAIERPQAKRIERLESLLDMLLQASLRGRLLPQERRTVKRYLEERRQEKRQIQENKERMDGPACPACQLPIPDQYFEKCPHCSVLLEVAQRAKRR